MIIIAEIDEKKLSYDFLKKKVIFYEDLPFSLLQEELDDDLVEELNFIVEFLLNWNISSLIFSEFF